MRFLTLFFQFFSVQSTPFSTPLSIPLDLFSILSTPSAHRAHWGYRPATKRNKPTITALAVAVFGF